MRCQKLLLIFIVCFMLVDCRRPVRPYKSFHQQRPHCSSNQNNNNNPPASCITNQKSTCIASSAAEAAKAAKDQQICAGHRAGQRVKVALADKAEQAARAAEAELNGKKKLLDQLISSLKEAQAVEEEVKKTIAQSGNNLNGVKNVFNMYTKLFDRLQCLQASAKKNLQKLSEVVQNSQSDIVQKQHLLRDTKRQLETQLKCRCKAKKDYEFTATLAQKAAVAAEEAKQRIESIRGSIEKIKKLKKKDVSILRNIIGKITHK
ncbi:uncharacterized protein LOC108602560 [Drosophila busckii]|uniref:uncharacterized protein LOC108602560 n=1 Tax=Drosophila busckii TaxID=30019 RepID=UPI00083F0769|nr:uncharacterized protein LOC108602560 [Drosophila busckii]